MGGLSNLMTEVIKHSSIHIANDIWNLVFCHLFERIQNVGHSFQHTFTHASNVSLTFSPCGAQVWTTAGT